MKTELAHDPILRWKETETLNIKRFWRYQLISKIRYLSTRTQIPNDEKKKKKKEPRSLLSGNLMNRTQWEITMGKKPQTRAKPNWNEDRGNNE